MTKALIASSETWLVYTIFIRKFIIMSSAILQDKFNPLLRFFNSMEILYRIAFYPFICFKLWVIFTSSAMKLLIFYTISQEMIPNWILIKILLPK